MKIVLRLCSVLFVCIALLFALFAYGALLRGVTSADYTTLFFALSLCVTVIVFSRAAIWLWSADHIWSVRYKRAEVCTIPALVLGMLAAMYYTPASNDPYAVTKFILTAEAFAAFVYFGVRLTFRSAKQVSGV